jgi:hypothetical protein
VFGVCFFDQVFEASVNKVSGGLVASVQIYRGYYRLEQSRCDRACKGPIGDHSLSHQQIFVYFQLTRHPRAASSGDQHGFHFGQVSLQIGGESVEEHLAGNQIQNGISEELKPFVA